MIFLPREELNQAHSSVENRLTLSSRSVFRVVVATRQKFSIAMIAIACCLCIDCHRENRIMIITPSIVYFYTPPLHTNLLAGSNNRSELPSQIIQSINSPPTTYHSEPVAYSPHLLSSVLGHIALAGALPLPSPFACIPPIEHTSIEDVAWCSLLL